MAPIRVSLRFGRALPVRRPLPATRTALGLARGNAAFMKGRRIQLRNYVYNGLVCTEYPIQGFDTAACTGYAEGCRLSRDMQRCQDAAQTARGAVQARTRAARVDAHEHIRPEPHTRLSTHPT